MEPMNNFTPRAQQVLALARKEADRFHHNYVGTEHLLLGLINLGQGVAVNVLQKIGLDLDTVRKAVEKQVGAGPEQKTDDSIPYTPRVKKVLVLSGKEAKSLNHSYVGTEHILLGLLREGDGVAARVLTFLKVDIDACRKEILKELDPGYNPDEDSNSTSSVPGASNNNSETKKETKTPALKAFGRDLTDLARKEEMDPVIGRSKEIRRMIQVLCRRTKNNPVLIGEAGVGKTSIVEGLAQEIASGNVPNILSEKRVITLDLALMVAGTKYRGQFEERIKALMDEIKKVGNIILFIDELHTIVGAGAAEGAMDASNIIKPALSRGELQCVGATTLVEYRKFIEKDSALDRRFQSIKVEAPSVADSILILSGIQKKYEEHHQVTYTVDAISSAAKLSDRYITSRYLPDKAIDIIDEAGSRKRIESLQKPPQVDHITEETEKVCKQKEDAISLQNFEEAAKYRDKEKQLKEQKEKILDEWNKSREEQKVIVDEDEILTVVSEWTGIPLSRMEQKETEKLLSMENDLHKKVVGQHQAIEVISKAIRRSRADLKDPSRPIGSFMFLGATGVGKTHLAKTLAELMFGKKDSIIQVDMSEYMEKFSVSRLVGSPPGYVGYDEGGQLTERVRRQPYSLVLFDEIEKAHPDVVQLLLQVLEDGRLTDSLGRTVDFRNTILIMTSNVGAELLQRNTSMGFGVAEDENQDFDKVKSKIMEEVKKSFKPEFLNRLNEMVIFHSLDKENLKEIIDIELSAILQRLKTKDIIISVSDEAKDFLIEKGYDAKYGARPLRRALEKHMEDPLAEAILRRQIKHGFPISILPDGDKLVFKQNLEETSASSQTVDAKAES